MDSGIDRAQVTAGFLGSLNWGHLSVNKWLVEKADKLGTCACIAVAACFIGMKAERDRNTHNLMGTEINASDLERFHSLTNEEKVRLLRDRARTSISYFGKEPTDESGRN